MFVKVFVLGRPGSGKSTAVGIMLGMVRYLYRGWSTLPFNDFGILKDMFMADTECKQFRPTEYGGFAVLNFSVLDAALRELQRRVSNRMFLGEKNFITIEFARDDYQKVLKVFHADFLQDAYFLYIDLDVETCICRIHRRVDDNYANPLKPDNHFVPDETLRGYYARENAEYVNQHLKTEYGIKKAVKVISNTGTWQEFKDQVCDFVNIILWQEDKPAMRNSVWPLLEL